MNRAVEEESESHIHQPPNFLPNQDPRRLLAAKVSSKLEQGDFRGAVRLASSDDSFCIHDENSLELLRGKHLSAHPDSIIPQFQQPDDPLLVGPEDVTLSIFSFPSGSACGPDGLYPQHLKDLTSPSLGAIAHALKASLMKFINLVLSGGVPSEARQFFFGANLIGLNKADGGV